MVFTLIFTLWLIHNGDVTPQNWDEKSFNRLSTGIRNNWETREPSCLRLTQNDIHASITGFKQQGARRDTAEGRGRDRDLKYCTLSLELDYHRYCLPRRLGIFKEVNIEVCYFAVRNGTRWSFNDLFWGVHNESFKNAHLRLAMRDFRLPSKSSFLWNWSRLSASLYVCPYVPTRGPLLEFFTKSDTGRSKVLKNVTISQCD